MSFNPDMTMEEAKKVAQTETFFENLQYVEDIEEFFKLGVEVRKFVAFHKDVELINTVKEKMGRIEGLAVSSSFSDNIELTQKDAQKGIILKRVATKMGIDSDNVMILGDSFNDYSMFTEFKESVAMKNAIPEVKEIAKYITDSNDNLGVAKAIYCAIDDKFDSILK